MNPMDQINAQIAAATQAAAAGAQQLAPAAAPGYGAPAQPAYQAPAQVQPGRPVTLGEMLAQGGMKVDLYITPKEAGIVVGKDGKNTVEELEVEFKLSDVVPFFGLRYGANPVTYLRSYDRMTEARSKKPWSQCQSEAQAADPKCRGDYPAVDIPFVYVGNDIVAEKGENKGKPLVKNGQRLGWSSSITNYGEFSSFIKPYEDLRAQGQLPADLRLRGKLVHKPAEGGGQSYGKIDFVDFIAVGIGDADAVSAASAAADDAGGDDGQNG